MLTALLEGQKIFATDQLWDGQKEKLRELCNGRAVCPVCREPIICKFGQSKIHHFAHSRGVDCPGNRETIEHLLGKDLLYRFLKEHLGEKAEVEVEYPLPELRSTCDVFIRMPDERYWAVDFFCGQWKEKEIRDRLNYYRSKSIDVVWLVSIKRYQEVSPEIEIKLRVQERLLLTSTGLDKLYANDWYQKIVRQGIYYPLATDDDAGGTLNFFDVEGKKLKIIRSLKPFGCVTTYRVGAVIEGFLEKVQITTKQHVWYFKKEEIWKERWMEAKSLLARMKAKREKAEKEAARVRARALATRREIGLTGSLPPAGMEQDRKEMNGHLGAKEPEQNIKSSKPDTGSWPADVDRKEYHCSKCNGLFTWADMVKYVINTKEGVCHACMYGKK